MKDKFPARRVARVELTGGGRGSVRRLGFLSFCLDAPAQQQALVDAKKAIDTLTLALLNRHNFSLGPNWNIHELTVQVIEENVNNLKILLDTVNDLATYGVTSEFFISTIHLLEHSGWGLGSRRSQINSLGERKLFGEVYEDLLYLYCLICPASCNLAYRLASYFSSFKSRKIAPTQRMGMSTFRAMHIVHEFSGMGYRLYIGRERWKPQAQQLEHPHLDSIRTQERHESWIRWLIRSQFARAVDPPTALPPLPFPLAPQGPPAQHPDPQA
ncbi:hypothetical protein L1987_33109 [Smallanthus sonchifolius]|uniref:Uncharacterized protein n=1 Tax=Smallanthus sonchifolius TaxID=185202 RepID=A0ACB9HRG0_9ASTR|nr:hypothetical protein L1987_33109 [Smallanthus sonchifolius]